MILERTWAMPSADTLTVKPIYNFVRKHLAGISVDPFARNQELATYTNDLNPETVAQYHMDAGDFVKMLHDKGIKADTVIFDPPYSPRKISECYKGIDRKVTMEDTQLSHLCKRVRDEINLIVPIGGKVLSFGWNSCGMGKNRGFDLIELLLICHGGGHNDTICLCEVKARQ